MTEEEEPSQTSSKAPSDNATRIKRIKRGILPNGDRLLDWLELGIFDALEKKHLKAVQFVIYLSKEHPEDIFECYTFSFAYAEGEPALTIEDSQGRNVIVKHAKADLQNIMRKMVVVGQNLAPLPGICSLLLFSLLSQTIY